VAVSVAGTQQDDDRSETADTGTCTDDLKHGQLIGNVDRRQCNIGTVDNGDAAMVDRQVVTAVRSRA